MQKGSKAPMDRKLEDKVEPAINPEPKKAGSIRVVNVGYDPELRQEISYPTLLFLVLLDQPLHRHKLAVGQAPLVHFCVAPFPDQVLWQKLTSRQ